MMLMVMGVVMRHFLFEFVCHERLDVVVWGLGVNACPFPVLEGVNVLVVVGGVDLFHAC